MNSEYDFNEIYNCYNIDDNYDLELPLNEDNTNNIFKQNYIDIENISIYSTDNSRRLSLFFNKTNRNTNTMIFPEFVEFSVKKTINNKKKNIFLKKLKKLFKFN